MRVFLLIIFTIFNISFSSNNNCEKVEVFFVIKYLKDEIKSLRLNEKLKNQEKSYSKVIDLTTTTMFFSSNKNNIANDIRKWKSSANQDIYFLPTLHNQMYFDKYDIKPLVLSYLNKQTNCTYYQIKNEEKFIYKIYYIEGSQVSLELDNNDINKVKLDLSDEIDKNAKTFNVHFIYEVNNIECNKQFKNIFEWE